MFKLIAMKREQNEWRGVVETPDWPKWVWSQRTHTEHTFYLQDSVWINMKTGYTASTPMANFLDAKLRLEKRFRDNHERTV